MKCLQLTLVHFSLLISHCTFQECDWPFTCTLQAVYFMIEECCNFLPAETLFYMHQTETNIT